MKMHTVDMIIVAHAVASAGAVFLWDIIPRINARNLTYGQLIRSIVASIAFGWFLIIGLVCWYAGGGLMWLYDNVGTALKNGLDTNIFKDKNK